MTRYLPRVLSTLLLLVCLSSNLAADPAEPASSADGVGLIGEVTAVSGTQLTLNDGRQVHTIALAPGTQVTAGTDHVKVGAPVFVGAHYVNGTLTARSVHDLSGAEPRPGAVEDLKAVLERKFEAGTGMAEQSGNTNCVVIGGFEPTSDVLNFPGCWGWPSLNLAPSFSPIEMFTVAGVKIHLTSFDMALSTGGGFFEFPFRFSAIDVASRAFEQWVNDCLNQYPATGITACPITRPTMPLPGAMVA